MQLLADAACGWTNLLSSTKERMANWSSLAFSLSSSTCCTTPSGTCKQHAHPQSCKQMMCCTCGLHIHEGAHRDCAIGVGAPQVQDGWPAGDRIGYIAPPAVVAVSVLARPRVHAADWVLLEANAAQHLRCSSVVGRASRQQTARHITLQNHADA